MNDVAFSEPVILHLPGTGVRKVATSFEAVECLRNEWPQWARQELAQRSVSLSRRARRMAWREGGTAALCQSRGSGGAIAGRRRSSRRGLQRAGIRRGKRGGRRRSVNLL
jgi:hypothetical protein